MNLTEYSDLVKSAKKNYKFLTINPSCETQAQELLTDKKRVCFLRHDIDFSPRNALRMAQVEKKHDVKATYTILLTGEFYNPFEKKNRGYLCEIVSHGHQVGLHFDPKIHDIKNEQDLDSAIKSEKRALEDLIEKEVNMFSFHNTTDFSMSCRKKFYGECQNAYSDFFHNEVEYTSDSNGYWRHRDWKQILSENHDVIQILTHPVWWQPDNSLPPLETVMKFMFDNYKEQMEFYNGLFENQTERENISLMSDILKSNDKINDTDILNKYVNNNSTYNFITSNNANFSEIEKLFDQLLKK
jgi:peptidoglycan/xylan/chitin deacetylase (PgdA/CDA1 family)